MNCLSCKYRKGNQCRLYPPEVVYYPDSFKGYTFVWTETKNTDLCGQYEFRQPVVRRD